MTIGNIYYNNLDITIENNTYLQMMFTTGYGIKNSKEKLI